MFFFREVGRITLASELPESQRQRQQQLTELATQKMPSFTETFVGAVNILQVLIETYGPRRDSHWKAISANPNLTFEMIKYYHLQRKILKLDWEEISEHKTITMEHVKAHPLWPWNLEGLSRNPNLTVDFVKEHSEENWNWWSISNNDKIVMELIELFPDKNWDWDNVSWYENLTIEFVKKYIDKPWNWENMSYNDDFATPEIVEANLDMPWNWSALTTNKNFTMEYIESHIDFPWSLENVCLNDNITAEFFKTHIHKIVQQDYCFSMFESPNLINETMTLLKEIPNLKVNWWGASGTFPIQFIEENPNFPWEWEAVSRNPNLTPAFIEKHVDTLNCEWLSVNPGVTMDFVETHQGEHYRWDWDKLSLNPNITFEFIQKHSDKLNFQRVLSNEFIFENQKKQKERKLRIVRERTDATKVDEFARYS